MGRWAQEDLSLSLLAPFLEKQNNTGICFVFMEDLSLLALASYSGTGAKEIELPLDETAAITE